MTSYSHIKELKKKAINLENEAKKEMQNKNFKKAAELFLESSKIYDEIRDEKNKNGLLQITILL
ncbi:diguanylate cyclase (GGDEF domain) with PAS/PAC sensor [Methanocaldococcus lauensis]|uniref:Diguanylate cyclase (GGDEF domain) with PAS/PAC sensor n=1 Tax=Methanocaldococcus lauensis TaxID=2546128 RepID=A0A8D6PUG1_9EURY|nr:hypothetical protein [Methanocaldococcus lauensis]CAB3288870.1 diguanylate cyclase (GGDEF domain) with PAS/PAC sensor [Methanocaldococcus lauensis]